MSDLRSVSACAKVLGLSRQRMSQMLDDAKVNKIKKGREVLIDFTVAQQLVLNAAAQGRMRTPKPTPKSPTDQLIEMLREENASQRAQIDKLLDKVEGYEVLKAENRLLRGEIEKREARAPSESGILSRLDLAIKAFKGN